MTLPPPSDQFFHKLARAQTRVLLLDYDGTLAPFSVERDGATPYPGVRQALSNILLTGHTKLVIVSGRMLKGLTELLDLDPLPEMWGTYGWERHTVDGHYQLVPVPQIAREGLEQALQGADKVTICHIYSPPGRDNDHAVSAADLAAAVGPQAGSAANFGDAYAMITLNARAGDLILCLGAGDIVDLSARLASWLEERR